MQQHRPHWHMKMAPYSFSGSIPAKFEHKLRRHKQTFGKITTTVWKGIFGIRDLTKIRCGNWENDKYIDGIRDLTVPREAGLAKNWARDAGLMFACLSGMPETFKNTRKFKISIERINLHLTFISFCRH